MLYLFVLSVVNQGGVVIHRKYQKVGIYHFIQILIVKIFSRDPPNLMPRVYFQQQKIVMQKPKKSPTLTQ